MNKRDELLQQYKELRTEMVYSNDRKEKQELELQSDRVYVLWQETLGVVVELPF